MIGMIDDPVLINDWHPVATVKQLKKDSLMAARLLNEDLVLWWVDGQPLAWQDLCVHRGTRLSLGQVVEGNKLQCPYHGWTYDREGKCVKIPAHPQQTPPQKAVVKRYRAKERYGLIWVSLGNPQNDIPPFPEWDDAAYRKILCGPYQVNASGPRIVENFLDIAHFAFVHDNILGVRDRPEIGEYHSEIRPEGVISSGVRVYQPDPYGTGQGDFVSYTYHVYRPLTASLTKTSDGPRFTIFLTITPIQLVESTAWMWMAQNFGYEIPEEEIIAYQDTIFAQDLPILESQRPELLPLDLQAELHLRSDRTAISYRKWLTTVYDSKINES